MAERRHLPQRRPERQITSTPEFRQWASGLDAETRWNLQSAIERIASIGPTLGRPHVDRIHQSRVHKLKEVRIGSGIRALFAFDSNQNLVMLNGGNKTGQWNKWYPSKIKQAERLYGDHERRIGKEAPWLSGRGIGRTSSGMGR